MFEYINETDPNDHVHMFVLIVKHRLIELTTRNRKESELEVEQRVRSSQVQSDHREKNHRQRIKGLEEQIAALRDQLSREIRTRQSFLSHTQTADEEIKQLHSILTDSLHTVARNCQTGNNHDHDHDHNGGHGGGSTTTIVVDTLDMETRRLNESMGSYIHETPVRNRSPVARQQQLKCLSPTRLKLHHRY